MVSWIYYTPTFEKNSAFYDKDIIFNRSELNTFRWSQAVKKYIDNELYTVDELGSTVSGVQGAGLIGYNGFNGWTTVKDGLDYIGHSLQATGEPTGFQNQTDSTISWDNASRTLTLAPVGSFTVWHAGTPTTITSNLTSQIDDTEGMWYFYIDSDGVLQNTQSFTHSLITDECLVAMLYWDATNNEAVGLGEERHGIKMDGATHLYLHETFGARWESGGAISPVVVDGNGNTDSHATIAVSDLEIHDEDIEHVSSDKAQVLTAPAQIPVIYLDGAAGNWRSLGANDYPIADAVKVNAKLATAYTRPCYNQWTGATWQLTEVTNNKFLLAHIFATNSTTTPVIAIVGQDQYDTRATAQAGALTDLTTLYTTGLPMAEFVALGTLIYQTSDGYSGASKARIISTDEGGDYIDWRIVSPTKSLGIGVIDDGRFFLLGGRVGGQIAYGGTDASDDLTLESTSNATKGYVNLQPNGGNVGIGDTTPSYTLDVNGAINTTSLYRVDGAAVVDLNASGDLLLGSGAGVSRHTVLYSGGGSESIRIQNDGNVGIGTTPSYKLHLSANNLLGATDNDETTIARFEDTFTTGGSKNRFNIKTRRIDTQAEPSNWYNSALRLQGDIDNSATAQSWMEFRHPSSTTTDNAIAFGEGSGDAGEWMVINNGSVGIGETTPIAKLHIKTADSAITPFANYDELFIENSGHAGITIGAGTAFIAGIAYGCNDGNGDDATKCITYYNNDTEKYSVYINSADRLTVTETGNVGIGTDSPEGQLHLKRSDTGVTPLTTQNELIIEANEANVGINILGATTSACGIICGDSDAATRGLLIYNQSATLDQWEFGTAGTAQQVVIDSAGQVGIGTASPDDLLHVEATADVQVRLTSQDDLEGAGGTENIGGFIWEGQRNSRYDTCAAIRARQDGTWSTATANYSPAAIEFFTQDATASDTLSTARMTINSVGNVGIGKAPSYKLDIDLATNDFAIEDCITGASSVSTLQAVLKVRYGAGTVGYVPIYQSYS